jgi:hypothetical protein
MNGQLISAYSSLEPAVNLDANASSFQPFLESSPLTSPAQKISTARSAASLLFIDSTLADYQTLNSAVVAGTEVHILQAEQDAIAQITQVLSGQSNISSLHIVSHGNVGGLQFGANDLTLNNLSSYASQLQSWAGALTEDADILFYGCNVAAGDMGESFIQLIGELTQADVAASIDLTGHDGNWELEFQSGSIETTLPFKVESLAAYQNNLLGSDFDNNGSDDLVRYNYYTGAVELQLMNGSTPLYSINMGTAGGGWQVAGLADFDGNGYDDLLWHNVATGSNGLWLMNGTNVQSYVLLPDSPANSDWRIVGVDDFDLNGTPDLLWRSNYHEMTGVWMMTGTAMTGIQVLPGRSRDWVVSGVADVDNNLTPDILWQNRVTGQSDIWQMSGTTIANTITLPTLNSRWVAHEMSDWNNDGFVDILWRNYSTGETQIWSLNGGNYTNSTTVNIPGNGAGWMILDCQDVNGDGFADLIVRNYVTGENGFWMMNGTNYDAFVSTDSLSGLWDIIAA